MRTSLVAVLTGVAVLAATACKSTETHPTHAAAPTKAPAIDSILPIEEHLRRFRAGLAPVDSLTSGSATSPDSLVRRMVGALAAADTAELVRLLLTRTEFAYVYYPRHIYAKPPYELDPGTFWMMIQGNSAKGLTRMLRRFGGHRLEYLGHACKPAATVESPISEQQACVIRFRADGEFENRRLFGSIVQAGGRHKFISYANDF